MTHTLKHTLSIAGFSVAMLMTTGALAQPFGEAGQVVLGAGSLFGVTHSNIKLTLDTPAGDYESELSQTNVDVLGDEASLGVHYVAVAGLTLGAAFVFRTESGETKDTPPGSASTTTDIPTETKLSFGIRVGYAAMFTENVGVWPGLSFEYSSIKQEDDSSETTITLPNASVGVPLVLSPVEHFAITFGPTMGIGFAGSVDLRDKPTGQTVDGSASAFIIGANGGVLGYF